MTTTTRTRERAEAFRLLRIAATIIRSEHAIGTSETLPFSTRFPHYYTAYAIRRAIKRTLREEANR